MKTDDLIRTLAQDKIRATPPRRLLPLALGLAVLVSAILFMLGLGPRADFAEVAGTWRFAIKPMIPLILAGTGIAVAMALVDPVRRARLAPLVIAPALLAVAVMIELAALPAGAWGAALVGENALKCLIVVPSLALAPLAAFLWVAQSGATTRPALTGAIAGLLAAGIGAGLYALHCPDDSPLFVATWYSLGALVTTGIGALAGHKLLRW
jgi:hypothetical protein